MCWPFPLQCSPRLSSKEFNFTNLMLSLSLSVLPTTPPSTQKESFVQKWLRIDETVPFLMQNGSEIKYPHRCVKSGRVMEVLKWMLKFKNASEQRCMKISSVLLLCM